MITRKQFEQARRTLDRNQAEYVKIDNAFASGKLAEEQARSQMDAMIDDNNKAMAICAEYKHQQASTAAAMLGSIKSKRKAKSSRANGRKGGRPRKSQ